MIREQAFREGFCLTSALHSATRDARAFKFETRRIDDVLTARFTFPFTGSGDFQRALTRTPQIYGGEFISVTGGDGGLFGTPFRGLQLVRHSRQARHHHAQGFTTRPSHQRSNLRRRRVLDGSCASDGLIHRSVRCHT